MWHPAGSLVLRGSRGVQEHTILISVLLSAHLYCACEHITACLHRRFQSPSFCLQSSAPRRGAAAAASCQGLTAMSTITSHFKQQKAHAPTRQQKKAQQQPQAVPALAEQDDGHSHTERELRQFDLDSRFGPCIGLTRLERWERAAKLGLEPPLHVRQLLTSSSADVSQECLWHGRV